MGFGVTQIGFAYEAHMDTIAAELKIDPVKLRLKNIYYDNCELPTGQIIETVTSSDTMSKCIDMAGWKNEVSLS